MSQHLTVKWRERSVLLMTRTYSATSPDGLEIATITTGRNIQWATWGYDEVASEWSHLGWSIRKSQAQAESSARSTGPYFHAWKASPAA